MKSSLIVIPFWIPYITDQDKISFYIQFLEKIREKQYDKFTYLEKHHVVPKHAGGTDKIENIIRVSIQDHIALHFYRFLAYNEIGDKVAYEMRINDNANSAKIRSQLSIAANKSKKNLFWDHTWQSLQGKKGGKKGGLSNSLKQQLSRSQIGKLYGKKVGVSNQSLNLQIILKYSTTWTYKDNSIIVIESKESAIEIIKELQNFKPGSILKPSAFYKVLHGKRKQMYGWKYIISNT